MWNDFKFRPDDIVIGTYAKSGTTWMQQIIGQLVFNGAEDVPVADLSPWLDLRIPPAEVKLGMLEAQTHRRFIKTHLPVDALRFSPTAKYIYVVRDGRDVVFSLYNHHKQANARWYELLNNTPGRVGPPIEPPGDDVVAYFEEWLEKDGFPFWSFWENIRSWWEVRHLPNVRLVHFADLKRDLEGEVRSIAEFLDMNIPEAIWPIILDHSSFEYMKDHADLAVPLKGIFWEGGAKTFVHKGTNGRWNDVLPQEDIEAYEARSLQELGPELAAWVNRA